MKFKIEEKIFRDFDKPFIGVIIAKGINNNEDYPEILDLLRHVEKNLRKIWVTQILQLIHILFPGGRLTENLDQNPEILDAVLKH